MSKKLIPTYLIRYIHNDEPFLPYYFLCSADNKEHAVEQFLDDTNEIEETITEVLRLVKE